MRDFPPGLTDFTPGDTHRPWTSTPGRFLWWLVRIQGSVFWVVSLLSIMWLLPSAVTPWALGHAIDSGILAHDMSELRKWAGVLAIFTVGGACIGWLHHTISVRSWLIATYGTRELVQNKSLQLGHVLGRRTPTGEVLSIAESDSNQFGQFLEVANRAVGNLVAYLIVAVIVLSTNLKLGIIILLVAPILAFTSGPLLKPLQRAQTSERTRNSELTSMATDIVAGLRILRGIGGEKTFSANYDAQSQRVREAGVRAGLWSGAIDSIGVLLSGIFVVGLMYLGSLEVRAGTLTIGGLVAFLGYSLFLIQPIRGFFEFAQKLILARVSAEKTIILMSHDSPWPEPDDAPGLDLGGDLVDEKSGARFAPGTLTMVVSDQPDVSAEVADRLGRYLPDDDAIPLDTREETTGSVAKSARAENVTRRLAAMNIDAETASRSWGVHLGGVDLSRARLDAVRAAIMVLDAAPTVFAGTLQEAIDPHGMLTRVEAEAALTAAAAADVYEATPGGWQGRLDERGRGLSGGQRQRLVLARALGARPPVLVMVEPTSAVDAHTEALIAARLPRIRSGQTTVVMTTSPLLLHRADEVILILEGREVARGSHADLVAGSAAYRAVVLRGDAPQADHLDDSLGRTTNV